MTTVEDIQKAVDELLLPMANQRWKFEGKTRGFRVSSLPFCPLLSLVTSKTEESYTKSHYTEVGTALHTTIQTWLSLNKISVKKMYGKWKCTGCAKEVGPGRQPKEPCSCEHVFGRLEKVHEHMPKFWTYEELTVEYNGLSGHIDLIIEISPGKYILIDFKTYSLLKKRDTSYWKKDKPSHPSYVIQIRSYSAICREVYDLNIVGWAMVLVDRDRPIESAKDYHPIINEWNGKKSKAWLKKLDDSANDNRRYRALLRSIEDGKEDKAKKQLKEIVKKRPCHSQEDYNGYMNYKFFSNEKCPLLSSCKKGNKRALRGVHEALADEEW